jgi:hypothetical protein
MVSAAATASHVFALTCWVVGTYNLARPQAALVSFGLPAVALPSVNGTSLAAIAMGIYYHLAGFQENRSFFIATVPMRLLTASVFCLAPGAESDETRSVFRIAGFWEGGFAMVTAAALAFDWWAETTTSGRIKRT